LAVLVDSNVLLDVMTEDRRWFVWAAMRSNPSLTMLALSSMR
jgi:hypothetical protein